MLKLSFLLFFFTGFLLAETPSKNCKRAFNELRESKLLLALKSEKQAVLETWSSDLLARVVLELEGPYASFCPTDLKMKAEVPALKKAYLKKLGVEVEEKDLDLVFKGLLTLKDDVEKLKVKIQEKKIKVSNYSDIKGLYPAVDQHEGISLVAEAPTDFSLLKTLLKEVCAKAGSPCPFTQAGSLYKVLVTESPGVAAFIPEIGILVVSKELIQNTNALHKVVILHELSHVATLSAWNSKREDWIERFKDFSGWKKVKDQWTAETEALRGFHADTLTELSNDSPYSILPDTILFGRKGKKRLDGFVFAKSFKESMERNDISEDLADSIAAYFVQPSRFCLNGIPFAPRKQAWIENNVFKGLKKRCSTEQG